MERGTTKNKVEWANMIREMLVLISDLLPLKDYIAFRHVCRNWRTTPSSRMNITQLSQKMPWLLISSNDNDGKCFLVDPENTSISCSITVPDLRGAKFLLSKFGWLLAYRDGDLILSNPLSLQTINLPGLPSFESQSSKCFFKYLPTSNDCIVFVARTKDNNSVLEVNSCCIADHVWKTHETDVHDIELSPVLNACCCNCTDEEHCECIEKNEVLFYSSGDTGMSFNFKDANWSRFEIARVDCTPVANEMKDFVSRGDWLKICKFGRIGRGKIKISVCEMNKDFSDHVNFFDQACVVGDSDPQKSSDKITSVEAAWIEQGFF